jgi:DNA primase
MTQTTINTELTERCRAVPLHAIVTNHHAHRKVKIQCPFHQERTPSCVLFPTGGYKCFGCGARGNSVDFLVKMGATFEEAIEELKKHI